MPNLFKHDTPGAKASGYVIYINGKPHNVVKGFAPEKGFGFIEGACKAFSLYDKPPARETIGWLGHREADMLASDMNQIASDVGTVFYDLAKAYHEADIGVFKKRAARGIED